MGYGGKTVNGLSSLGPKMGGKAHGGGVKIEKNRISQRSRQCFVWVKISSITRIVWR